MLHLLTICSGNTCRSPVGEAILRNRLLWRTGEWRVKSAGVRANSGQLAARYSLELMNKRGIDLYSHRSHVLCIRDVESAHLLLCMEQDHVDELNGRFPSYRHKTYLLSNMVGESDDVADPFGGSLQDYELMIAHVERLIDGGLGRIMELAETNACLSQPNYEEEK